MGLIFGQLGTKIFGGLSAALLLVIGILWISLGAEKRHAAKVETRLAQTQAAFDATVADYRAKAAQAKADDLANKARIEAAQTQRTEVSSHDYEALRARYAAALERLRAGAAQADPGSRGNPPVPGPAGAAGPAPSAGAGAFVSQADLAVCSENTAKAETWLSWWKSVEAIPR